MMRIRQASFDGTIVETKDDTYKQGSRRLRQDPAITLNAAGGQTYVVEVMQYGIGGGRDFSLDVSFDFIPEATPTPFPTQTPVPRINVDFRLHPNPSLIDYERARSTDSPWRGMRGNCRLWCGRATPLCWRSGRLQSQGVRP